MAFCPSCGKVLPPNGVCECGYTAAAAPAPKNNGQAGAPGAAGAAGSGAFGEAVNVFVGAFKNPATNSQGVFTGIHVTSCKIHWTDEYRSNSSLVIITNLVTIYYQPIDNIVDPPL